MNFHNKTAKCALCAFCLLLGLNIVAAEADFRDVQIEKPFKALLTKKKEHMSLPGLKEFREADGTRHIVCIVSMASKGTTAKAKMTMTKICRTKAAAELLRAIEVEISGITRFEEKITSVSDGKKEKITSISNYLNVIEERVHGVVQTMPVVGTWYSLDGTEFYLAIGQTIASPAQAVEE